MLTNKTTLAILFFFLSSSLLFAQKARITGVITDVSGNAIPGASIQIGKQGTVSSELGQYSLEVNVGTQRVLISSIGYQKVEKSVEVLAGGSNLNFQLQTSTNELSEIVVTGSRSTPRSPTDTPLPIDALQAAELKTTGQTTFDKQLQYRVPSFNTINVPVNDATTFLDPYEIRNLGPSRTLLLINGKRKNLSSLLYVQFSPGRGETGADLSAIPLDAIKRVEILRDGASAQYGSDAIAGVINIILKDKAQGSMLTFNSGITSKGDGENLGLSFNSGFNFKKNGFLNYSLELNHQGSAVRSGIIDRATEKAIFGGSPEVNKAIDAFLDRFPTANNLNGTGKIQAAKLTLNGGFDILPNLHYYANMALVYKEVFSFANYRPPYWRTDAGLLHTVNPSEPNYTGTDNPLYNGYIGYHPTFNGQLADGNFTNGITFELNGWKSDFSATFGSNQQMYKVGNTINASLGAKSPTSFNPGGYQFDHSVYNYDLSKRVHDRLSLAFGSEARFETYEIIAGDTASYVGEGANSFPGINKINASKNRRFNIGVYSDATWDVTNNFLLNAAIRGERYSDFGGAFVWKLSSRYLLLNETLTLRASLSTGFRAPTLHQTYAQSTQGSYFAGSIQLSGLFNNGSKQAASLGIPKLKPEYSTNLTMGIGFNPNKNFSLTLDYYNINIKDRIVYSSSIYTENTTTQLYKILQAEGLRAISFFINGIETNTQGLDVVTSYRNIMLAGGKLGFNLAGNYQLNNQIVGNPYNPPAIASAGTSIINSQLRSLLTESRPQYKMVVGFDWKKKKVGITVNNTLFGPTKFQDLDNGGGAMEHIKQVFKPALVTDLNVNLDLSKLLSWNVSINNLFNILPSWDLEAIDATGALFLKDQTATNYVKGYLAFSNRYPIVGYNGSQFSQLGTTFQSSLVLKF